MEIEYKNKILWNGLKRPFGKRFLIAIPMYMYRINTYPFERGFNFFQKVVLKLKVKPGISNSTISEILGLPDDKLVTKVENQLKGKKLLDESGLITSEGLLVREQSDGFIVNTDDRKLGYIFQMVDKEVYYSNYIDKIQDVAFKKRGGAIRVNVYTDEYGEDKYNDAFVLDVEAVNLPRPSERFIIQAINNKTWLDMELQGQEHSQSEKDCDFNIEFISEIPELVWVCTYIYLPRVDGSDEIYEPNWRVLDPFGYGDSVKLKFYLESLQNQKLQNKLEDVFGDVETTANQKYSELKRQIELIAEDNIMQDFGLESHLMDKNIQQFLKRAVFYYYSLKYGNYKDSGDSQDFIINVQQLLETIFKIDREQRKSVYQRVDTIYFPNRETLKLYQKESLMATIYVK